MKIWLAIIRKSYLEAPCQDEISFSGNILKVTVLSDKDSSAQTPGAQGGLFASCCTLQRCLLPKARKLHQGWDMGLFFHVWACLIRSQGSPAQAGKCLLVSTNTDDRNVCLGHCSALNGAEKTLQRVLSTSIPSLGMPEEALAPWEEGTTFQMRTKLQQSVQHAGVWSCWTSRAAWAEIKHRSQLHPQEAQGSALSMGRVSLSTSGPGGDPGQEQDHPLQENSKVTKWLLESELSVGVSEFHNHNLTN